MSHNGWTNYATWRVNMEMADDTVSMLVEDGETFDDAYDLSQCIDGRVMDFLADDTATMIEYALAFLSDVNWGEIAEAALTDNPTLITGQELCPLCDANVIDTTERDECESCWNEQQSAHNEQNQE